MITVFGEGRGFRVVWLLEEMASRTGFGRWICWLGLRRILSFSPSTPPG
jgi:hypothetical protein